MVFICLIYFLIILEMYLQMAVVYIAVYFPYVMGFLAGSSLYAVWSMSYYPNLLPAYVVLIPGHPVLSYFLAIIVFEFLIFLSLQNSYTKKASIVFWCVGVPANFLTIFQITVASWQMAMLVTVVGLILFGIEGYIAVTKYDADYSESDNIVVTIINAVSYCVSIAMLVFAMRYCFWDIYMNSIGRTNTLVIVRNIVGGISIVAVLCVLFGPFVLEKIRNRY